jgi:hypothetical protein
MLLLVATIKPKNTKPGVWSHYCRLKLEEPNGKGRWSVMSGPFLPFSKDAPDARSGDWEYNAGSLFFWADGDPMQFVMTFDQLHWNFRVLCSQKDLTGKGKRSSLAGSDDDRLIWVMGPGLKKPPEGDVEIGPIEIQPYTFIPNYVPDGSDDIVPLPNYRPDPAADGGLSI